jgi:hypothetical protein
MIRHARRQPSLSLPISALPVAMIEPAFHALLMAPVGATLLLQTGTFPARITAVTMSAIAMRTDIEDGLTLRPCTFPMQQNSPIMNGLAHWL